MWVDGLVAVAWPWEIVSETLGWRDGDREFCSRWCIAVCTELGWGEELGAVGAVGATDVGGCVGSGGLNG